VAKEIKAVTLTSSAVSAATFVGDCCWASVDNLINILRVQCDQIGQNFAVWPIFTQTFFTFSPKYAVSKHGLLDFHAFGFLQSN
jgi:hypothetical protein